MRRAASAQWFLSFFVSPDRASALVGDLLERSTSVSWFTVCRIAVSAVIKDFHDVPGRLAFLAVQALVLQFAAWYFFVRFLPMRFLQTHGIVTGYKSATFFFIAWMALAWLAVGYWLARRAPGREMASCLTVFLLNVLVSGAVAAFSTTISVHFDFGAFAAQEFPLLLGVICARRMRLNHA